MKRIFSKKSGFTLVEIIIAFAVFAIMAVMIAQVLNLAIARRNSNKKLEDYLQGQNQTIIAREKKLTFEDDADAETLTLAFTNPKAEDVPIDLDYQYRDAEGTLGEKGGLNYFVGRLDYNGQGGYSETLPGAGDVPGGPADDAAAGGSSQMSRFDTRITGTKGVKDIKISWKPNAAKDTYTVTVTVNDSGIDSTMKGHSQVTLYFAEGVSEAEAPKILDINDNLSGKKYSCDAGKSDSLLYLKKTGQNGVNLHCKAGSYFSGSMTFIVQFDRPIENLGFGTGTNVTGSTSGDGTSTYTYKVYSDEYVNIFGAYEKKSAEAAS